MAGPPYSRASREYEFVAAIGSTVEVKQYDEQFNLVPPEPTTGVIFDIELGILRDIHKNRVITHSGSNGATLRTRVGFDWTYALTLSFPAQLIGGALAVAFAQQILGSNRSVWMRFYMGDPQYWTDRGLDIRTFLGRKSLLSTAEQRFANDGEDVVGLNIAGEGNSLLRAELSSSVSTEPIQVYP